MTRSSLQRFRVFCGASLMARWHGATGCTGGAARALLKTRRLNRVVKAGSFMNQFSFIDQGNMASLRSEMAAAIEATLALRRH